MTNTEKFNVILINDYRVVDDFAGVVVAGFAGISTFWSQFAKCECN